MVTRVEKRNILDEGFGGSNARDMSTGRFSSDKANSLVESIKGAIGNPQPSMNKISDNISKLAANIGKNTVNFQKAIEESTKEDQQVLNDILTVLKDTKDKSLKEQEKQQKKLDELIGKLSSTESGKKIAESANLKQRNTGIFAIPEKIASVKNMTRDDFSYSAMFGRRGLFGLGSTAEQKQEIADRQAKIDKQGQALGSVMEETVSKPESINELSAKKSKNKAAEKSSSNSGLDTESEAKKQTKLLEEIRDKIEALSSVSNGGSGGGFGDSMLDMLDGPDRRRTNRTPRRTNRVPRSRLGRVVSGARNLFSRGASAVTNVASRGVSAATNLASRGASAATNLASRGLANAASTTSNLVSKVAPAGLRGLGTAAAGAARFLGPAALAATAAYGGFRGVQDTTKNFNLEEGAETTLGQKTASGLAGAIDTLTFGLGEKVGLDEGTVARGLHSVGSKLVEYSPVGLARKGFSAVSDWWDREKFARGIDSSKDMNGVIELNQQQDVLFNQQEDVREALRSGTISQDEYNSKMAEINDKKQEVYKAQEAAGGSGLTQISATNEIGERTTQITSSDGSRSSTSNKTMNSNTVQNRIIDLPFIDEKTDFGSRLAADAASMLSDKGGEVGIFTTSGIEENYVDNEGVTKTRDSILGKRTSSGSFFKADDYEINVEGKDEKGNLKVERYKVPKAHYMAIQELVKDNKLDEAQAYIEKRIKPNFENLDAELQDRLNKVEVPEATTSADPLVGMYGAELAGMMNEGMAQANADQGFMGYSADELDVTGRGLLPQLEPTPLPTSDAISNMTEAAAVSTTAAPVINNITNNTTTSSPAPSNVLTMPNTPRQTGSSLERFQNRRAAFNDF